MRGASGSGHDSASIGADKLVLNPADWTCSGSVPITHVHNFVKCGRWARPNGGPTTGRQGMETAASAYSQWDAWEAPAWDAWKNKPAKGQANQADGRDASGFPKYQDMKTTNVMNSDLPEDGVGCQEELATEVPIIQKLVNNIRKAESRVRKSRETRTKREMQWAHYQEEVKKLFVGQRAEYRADLAKLDKEEMEAQQAREAAVLQLKSCINGQSTTTRKVDGVHYDKEDLQSWDELMGALAPKSPKSPQESMNVWLQEMIRATSLGGTAALTAEHKEKINQWMEESTPQTPPTRRTMGLQRTPPRATTRCPQRVIKEAAVPVDGNAAPPYAKAQQGIANTDPYQASPGQGMPPGLSSPGLGGKGSMEGGSASSLGPPPRMPSPVKPKNGLVVPGSSVKQMSKQLPVPAVGRTKTLADMVESKRMEAQAALLRPEPGPLRFMIDDDDDAEDNQKVTEDDDLTMLE